MGDTLLCIVLKINVELLIKCCISKPECIPVISYIRKSAVHNLETYNIICPDRSDTLLRRSVSVP